MARKPKPVKLKLGLPIEGTKRVVIELLEFGPITLNGKGFMVYLRALDGSTKYENFEFEVS